ncbi:sodium-independent anion transporter [Actinoplanes sp. OR16]|uniref:SulP family inorganic anion transporter n=1 Tax=Actinoplanes sp. OR16 TaxID=946334 RepID=UPI000F6E0861|nr:SulP family inorganic anion transporter [Actinoplanes sp. OR16]BBH71819.1 sodium-independent anion transporter [Actinoplanes sp. OR16]
MRRLGKDAVAGVVLGVESVPDGLASGLLAGVNPLAGLYAYMFGTLGGAVFTSSAYMAVQGTGAMGIIVADVPAVHGANDPAKALFTLAMLTGVIMVAAGLLRLGFVLRFVPNSVMVAFLSAVGVNIVLGQLSNFTGYEGNGVNRVLRALDTILHPGRLDWQSVATGAATILLILLFERTRIGTFGLVVAVVITSIAVPLLGWTGVRVVNDISEVPNALPTPVLPDFGIIPALLIPALALAFVGLLQGAAISAGFPNPDGKYPDASRDFIGQGAGNLTSGIFQGMPVGGSVSGTSLNRAAGARSRLSLIIAAVVMAIVVMAFADVVGQIVMPALAGLLMLIGLRTVKPASLQAVWRTGSIQKAVLACTFTLTMLIPLQYAVLAGVGLAVILHVIRQSNQVTIKRWQLDDDGNVVETDPPAVLSADEVVVLQPYGSLYFAAARVLEDQLPAPSEGNSVVIIRLRGREQLDTTFLGVLRRYAEALRADGSKLMLVSATDRVQKQLRVAGLTDLIEVYSGDERVGASTRRAYDDAIAWIHRG